MTTPDNNPPPSAPQSQFKAILDKLPLLQFAGAIIIAICATWTTLQITQVNHANQVNNLAAEVLNTKETMRDLKNSHDKQIQEMRSEMVSKTFLDARIDMVLKLQQATREDVNTLRQTLERQHYR